MTLNRVKLGRTFIFMKHLASLVSLIFPPKTLIWNKITFPASNLLNFAELVKNQLIKCISKKLPTFFFLSNLSLLIKGLDNFKKFLSVYSLLLIMSCQSSNFRG